MHMNSVPQHLLSEDRQEYERILDEALRSAPHRPELAAVGQRLNPEQLRTMALNATALITAAAATEYQHYVKVREELRQPAPSTPLVRAANTGSTEPGTSAIGLATTMGEVAETAGAGAVAVVAVLAPVLAGTAAAIFLLVGYILKMLDPRAGRSPRPCSPPDGCSARMTAASDPGRRGRSAAHRPAQPASSLQAGALRRTSEEVTRAREAWREALLERGILPFLREALADPGHSRAAPHDSHRRRPAACRTSATTARASAARTTAPPGPTPQLHEPGLQQPGLRGARTPAGVGRPPTPTEGSASR